MTGENELGLVSRDSEIEMGRKQYLPSRHGAQGAERDSLLSGALIATAMLFGGEDYGDLAVTGGQLGVAAVNQKYSRDAEREADFYGIRYIVRAGYDPSAAVALQQTFARLNAERRQDSLSGLFSSHPPSRERVDNNRETVSRLAARPSFRGERTYQQRVAHLNRVKPAYAA